MHRGTQPQPAPMSHDAGDAQNLCAVGLDRPVADRALIELSLTGPALPPVVRAHDAAIERLGEPIVTPAPIDWKQLAMLRQQLGSLELRDAQARGQGDSFDTILNCKKPALICVSYSN